MINKSKSSLILALTITSLLTACEPKNNADATNDTLTPLSDIATDASQINGFREGVYDYVYLGTFDENPIKWKVLANHRNSGEADGLFVLADSGIENSRFGDSADWNNSLGREWCRNFYENPNVFSDSERNLILYTQKKEEHDYEAPNGVDGSYLACPLDGDYCFFLSVEEAMQTEYGFPNSMLADPSRSVEYNGRLRWWWLRSRYSEDSNRECLIYRDGNITNDISTRSVILARPAFNLSKSDASIFFAQKTEEANTWRLTLTDEKNLPTPEITNSAITEGQISFHCTNPVDESCTNLSVLITDKEQNEIYAYETFSKESLSPDKDLLVTLPKGFSEDICSVLVFNENNDSLNAVSYAGKPIELQFTE
ncbi:MAG: DUF6273 domain-containing protein [Lachnospiraceae bacterium]